MDGGREGEREGGREGEREGGRGRVETAALLPTTLNHAFPNRRHRQIPKRQGWMEGGREGGREGAKEGWMDGGREGGREGGRDLAGVEGVPEGGPIQFPLGGEHVLLGGELDHALPVTRHIRV
jgi:hypothetical protein